MREAMKRWWAGEYVPPPPNDPNSSIIFLSPGEYKRHWSSRAAHTLVDFYLKEWKWLLPFLVGLVAAIVALRKTL